MSAQLHEMATGETGETRDGTRDGGRDGMVVGVVLVVVGVVLLAAQVFALGAWALVLMGLIFVAAGIGTHAAGWFIPGGILGGIGLGAMVTESGLVAGDPAEGGAFLLAFALGWASIYVLSRLFARAPMRWPLIPAAVMAVIGTPLLIGGAAGEAFLDSALSLLSYGWPLALIAAGLVSLARARRG